MTVCVPIKAVSPSGEDVGGTGFFGSYRGKVWFLTNAHVALAMNTPHQDWAKWPATLSLILTGSNEITALPLFHETAEGRRRAFAWYGNDQGMADFIALPLSVPGLSRLGSIKQYDVLDLDAGEAAVVGETVDAIGYPANVKVWPTRPAPCVPLHVTQSEFSLLEFASSTVGGMSGGPIINRNGAVVGMTIGHNHGAGRGVPVTVIHNIIDLFMQDNPAFIELEPVSG